MIIMLSNEPEFAVLTAVTLKRSVFWDVSLCTAVNLLYRTSRRHILEDSVVWPENTTRHRFQQLCSTFEWRHFASSSKHLMFPAESSKTVSGFIINLDSLSVCIDRPRFWGWGCCYFGVGIYGAWERREPQNRQSFTSQTRNSGSWYVTERVGTAVTL
jgi:hypothetical protein